MQITHFGHSCILLDTGAARLLIDPGAFSSGFEQVSALDAVLVTHQHPDHLDVERIGALLKANPDARLIVDVLGGEHAVIHPDIPVIPNNAYLVDGTALHPGDAFVPPPGPVDVLFLPTGAPWLKLSEAVDYLRAVAPRTAVPIHEAILAMPQMYYQRFVELGPAETTVRVLDRAEPVTV